MIHERQNFLHWQIHFILFLAQSLFVLLEWTSWLFFWYGASNTTLHSVNCIQGQNVPWPPPVFFHSPSVKSWSQLAGSGPVPWRQAPTLFNSSASQPEFHPRVPYEVELPTGIDRIGASERPSFPSLEKRKIESFSERLMNGSLKLGTRDILENGHPGSDFVLFCSI